MDLKIKSIPNFAISPEFKLKDCQANFILSSISMNNIKKLTKK